MSLHSSLLPFRLLLTHILFIIIIEDECLKHTSQFIHIYYLYIYYCTWYHIHMRCKYWASEIKKWKGEVKEENWKYWLQRILDVPPRAYIRFISCFIHTLFLSSFSFFLLTSYKKCGCGCCCCCCDVLICVSSSNLFFN